MSADQCAPDQSPRDNRSDGSRLDAELSAPTVAAMTATLTETTQARADRSLAEMWNATNGEPDFQIAAHAIALRRWLNRWVCRIAYPRDEVDIFVVSLREWAGRWRASLPSHDAQLADLHDDTLDVLGQAYDDLKDAPASVDRRGRHRRIGPTASAKLLFALRPNAVTPWDRQIAATVGGTDQLSFVAHLKRCRAWASALTAECAVLGIDDLADYLGRPNSSVAKLIDEWLYLTVTRA